MNKLLLTLATLLLISGCSKEPNIYLNCTTSGGDYAFDLTINTSKKAFILSGQEDEVSPLFSYTEHDNKLISEKIFIDWSAAIRSGRYEDNNSSFLKMQINDFDEYEMYTFNKINTEVRGDTVYKDKEENYTYQCTATGNENKI